MVIRYDIMGWIVFCLWIGGVLGCGAADDATGNLGVEGATCQSSPECSPPLQCIGAVCTQLAAGDTGGDIYVNQDVLDSSASDILSASEVQSLPETAESLDIEESDVNRTNIFSDCVDMGIADQWEGTFMGLINFTAENPPPGLLSEGTLVVDGELSFEIKCLDQKLVVAGLMEGVGEATGQPGQYPYTSKLSGYYDPETKKIQADLIEGVITAVWPENPLIKVDIYYAGSLEGTLQFSGEFKGTWQGEETGNQLGIDVEALGTGTWQADPVL